MPNLPKVLVPPAQAEGLLQALRMLHAQREAAVAEAKTRPVLPFVEFCRAAYIRSDDPSAVGDTPWLPWSVLLERAAAWDAGQSEVVLKARQMGATWLLALFLAYRARRGAACGVISVGQREARDLLRRVRYIEKHLRRDMRVPFQAVADEIRYPASDGVITAFPSTEQAGISYTFNLAVMDEAAFHPWGAANYTALRPTLSAGGQFLALSTADPSLGPSGFFHDLYWDSKAGRTPYTAVFMPWYARPGRDRAWLERERAAFSGMGDEFNAYYPDTDTAAFVARSGLVYPQFNYNVHVRPAPFRLADARRVVAGVDFGGGDPTAAVVLGLSADHHVHQFAEFYKTGAVAVDQIVGFLSKFNCGVVVCDPSEPVAIATMVAAGIPARPADNRRGEGLAEVGFLLDHDRLSIDPACTHSIEEFPGYRWADRVDPNDNTRYRTRTPVNHHADAMDARRYACMEMLAMLRPMTYLPTRDISGRALATEAE